MADLLRVRKDSYCLAHLALKGTRGTVILNLEGRSGSFAFWAR